MKKLNKKGYMLIEVILSFAIAFAIVYFLLSLVIKLKTKNDDLMVETMTTTDKTIISNKLMGYMQEDGILFDCESLNIDKNTGIITYNDEFIIKINDYAKIEENISCDNSGSKISIDIPIKVDAIPDTDFSVDLDYFYGYLDREAPTCSLKIDNRKVIFDSIEDNMGEPLYSWITTTENGEYNGKDSADVAPGIFYGYVKDKAGNIGKSSIEIVDINISYKKTVTKCAQEPYSCRIPDGECSCSSTKYGVKGGSCNSGGGCTCPPGYNNFIVNCGFKNGTCYRYVSTSSQTIVSSCTATTNFSNCNSSNKNKTNTRCESSNSCSDGYIIVDGTNYCYKKT